MPGASAGRVVGIVGRAGAELAATAGWEGPAGAGFTVLLSPPVAPQELARRADLIVCAASGEELPRVLALLRGRLDRRKALVSTSAEVSVRQVRALVGPGPALFRAVIPVGTEPGEGAAALAPEDGTPAEMLEFVKTCFARLGTVEVVGEKTLDAVAAVTLGGAGFMCTALQGLEEGAVREGLPLETARPFAHQTALATALLLRDHAGSPADLKDQVASPGGTTIAALAVLEDVAVRGAFLRGVQRTATHLRARRDVARPSVIE